MSIFSILSRTSHPSSLIYLLEASFISAYENDDLFLLDNNLPPISLEYTFDDKYIIYIEGTKSVFL